MEQQTWKCLCGTENTGNFCSTCGRAKDSQQQFNNAQQPNNFTEQYFMMQMQQQEMLREQEEKRAAMLEEKERKQREYTEKLNAYNNQVTAAKLTTIKKWAGSWVVLALAILSSISVVFAIYSTFSNGINLLTIFSQLVTITLNVLVCIGFWLLYSQGKSKADSMKATGAKMLRGVLIFDKVITYIAYIAVLVILFVVLIIVMASGEILSEAMSGSGIDASMIGSYLTIIMLAIIAGVAIVFVFFIIYYSLASKYSKNVIYCINNKNVLNVKGTGIAVFFIIIGVITLINALCSIGMSAIMSELIVALMDTLGEIEGFEELPLGELIGLFGFDVTAVISQLVTALTYIFCAILAIQFGKLYNQANSKIALIEKPEL